MQTKIKNIIGSFFAVLLIGFFNNSARSEWTTADIGQGANATSNVFVGIGKNDGKMNIYNQGSGGIMFETTYSGHDWSQVSMQGAGDGINSISAGAGRNDGVPRVYASSVMGYIHEFSNTGTGWGYINCASLTMDSIIGVSVGAGRNDGVLRVYGTRLNGGVYECSYSGSWIYTGIGSGNNCVTVGTGRNDSVMRVYSASNDVYELNYSGGWSQTTVGSPGSTVYGISIGAGRCDGVMRIYAACWNGHIYEYSRTGSNWTQVDIGSTGSGITAISMGVGRNDGIVRIYAACGDGHIYEFSYTSSNWTHTDVGSAAQGMYGVSIGTGRNDGIVRVYGGSYTGRLYEFSWTPEPPYISSMDPRYALISAQSNLSFLGKDLLGTSVIKLKNVKTNQTISGSSLNVSGNSLTAQFSLPGTAGLFDLVLTKTGIDYTFKTFFTLLAPQSGPVQWQKNDLGKAGNACTVGSIVIADANRDNEAEVYVAYSGQTISCIKKNNSTWPVTSFLDTPGENFQQLLALDGNRDGEWELYAASAKPQIYQYQWGKPSPSSPVGAGGSLMVAGDGNHDGAQEIYAVSGNTTGQGLEQWNYSGSVWTNSQVKAVISGVAFTSLLAGDVDNDSADNSMPPTGMQPIIPIFTNLNIMVVVGTELA
jgi:hypothetical protein